MRQPDAAGIITSARHPLAVRVRKLIQRPQLARREAVLLLDGVHLIEEALIAEVPRLHPEAILTCPRFEATPTGRRLIAELQRRTWPLQRVSDGLMDRLAATQTPQGILGLFPRPEANLTDVRPSPAGPAFALLLAGLQDPGNLGMLTRTARAFGCAGLVTTPGTTDPFHLRALRAASGALLHLPVVHGAGIAELRAWALETGAHLIALDARAGEPPEQALGSSRGFTVLVLGSEGQGLAPEIGALCAARCRIPMRAGMDSLGVAAAGTIALYMMGRPRD